MNNFLTLEALDTLKELEYRKVVTRKRINEDLKEARAQGDLSENFEYKAAKRDEKQNEGRMRYLDGMIKVPKIIEDHTALDEVGLKSNLKILEDDDIDTFTIVTTIEADPINGLISIESPIGKAIYKHKAGEILEVFFSEGSYKVQIEKIDK